MGLLSIKARLAEYAKQHIGRTGQPMGAPALHAAIINAIGVEFNFKTFQRYYRTGVAGTVPVDEYCERFLDIVEITDPSFALAQKLVAFLGAHPMEPLMLEFGCIVIERRAPKHHAKLVLEPHDGYWLVQKTTVGTPLERWRGVAVPVQSGLHGILKNVVTGMEMSIIVEHFEIEESTLFATSAERIFHVEGAEDLTERPGSAVYGYAMMPTAEAIYQKTGHRLARRGGWPDQTP